MPPPYLHPAHSAKSTNLPPGDCRYFWRSCVVVVYLWCIVTFCNVFVMYICFWNANGVIILPTPGPSLSSAIYGAIILNWSCIGWCPSSMGESLRSGEMKIVHKWSWNGWLLIIATKKSIALSIKVDKYEDCLRTILSPIPPSSWPPINQEPRPTFSPLP